VTPRWLYRNDGRLPSARPARCGPPRADAGLAIGERAGKAVCPPFPTLGVQNARRGFFEEEEFRAVHRLLPTEVQPLAEFAYLTGWRLGEIVTLRWSQVDLRVGVVRLEPGSTKNDEGQVFPFAALRPLEALLRDQRASTDAVERAESVICPWVFHRAGRPIKNFRGAWEAACIAAGFFRVEPVPGRPEGRKKTTKLFHDFHRTAVRNLERAGVPRSVAMKLTGHKTESVYRRYAIVSEADLTQEVKRLNTLHVKGAGHRVEWCHWRRVRVMATDRPRWLQAARRLT
jgi:integrase